jgi:hypothetical protein
LPTLPGWVDPAGFDKSNARLAQLIDNDLEISFGYCKSSLINSHPILAMF